ncbi:hypothetical protein H8699_01535 [Christensenellaceae bacterium NSJ-44]|uniref:Uncharacterized protein n=2 Tax=Luoshenia tenuis TaxID=2763654 RepID=A0A926CYM0_9FIRM|nr:MULTISPECIES: hypothetical protein [Clostridia]MBC8528121.1 hypothetical protein [Luoshenia tenuis]SCJ48010.1 Uncharacterised protein [uncultured Clostridium sp.]
MKKRIAKQLFCFTYFFGFTTLLLSRTAFAYLDPATTSYLIQVVAGVFIAGGVAVGIFWKKISFFFKKRKMQALEKKLTREAAKREQGK